MAWLRDSRESACKSTPESPAAGSDENYRAGHLVPPAIRHTGPRAGFRLVLAAQSSRCRRQGRMSIYRATGLGLDERDAPGPPYGADRGCDERDGTSRQSKDAGWQMESGRLAATMRSVDPITGRPKPREGVHRVSRCRRWRRLRCAGAACHRRLRRRFAIVRLSLAASPW